MNEWRRDDEKRGGEKTVEEPKRVRGEKRIQELVRKGRRRKDGE